MPKRNFIGWDQDRLEAELANLNEELIKGKAATELGAGDTSFRFEVQVSIEKRIQMVLEDLIALDPDEYAQHRRRSTTQIVFPATLGRTGVEEVV